MLLAAGFVWAVAEQNAAAAALVGTIWLGGCLMLALRLRAGRLRALQRHVARLRDRTRARVAAGTANEARLRGYLMHLPDGLTVIRVEPDGRFACAEMNTAARTILDLGDREVIGMAPHEMHRAGEPTAIEAGLRECLEAAMPIRFNKVIVSRRGRRELRVELTPVRGPPTAEHPLGRIEWLLHTMRDVTDEAEREERLRESLSVEAVGRLTAGLAHDFNNLLQSLLGGLELAMSEVSDRPAAVESLNIATQAAHRGAQLTSQLLSFSRQQILRPVSVDIARQVHELALALPRTLGDTISVEVVVAPGLPPASADLTHFRYALLNLVLNARDAMPRGGALRIEAFTAGAELVVAVSDTGEGMSAEVLARACEPFFTTKGVNGAGLGLSMAHGFACQSGGDLRISSRVGEGTRVEMVLLPAPGRATEDALAIAETASRSGGRILVVDDDADVLQVTASFLRKAGFEVVEARDATLALAALSAGPRFDALVTDYLMTGMNGVDLVMRARAVAPGQASLIITGYAGAEGLRWLPPDVTILRKPFKRADFVRAVKTLVQAGRGVDTGGTTPATMLLDNTTGLALLGAR